MADERTVATRILDLYERSETTRRIVRQLELEGLSLPDGRAISRGFVDALIDRYEREVERQANPHEDDAFDSWVDDEAEGFGIGSDRVVGEAEEVEAATQPDVVDDPDDDEDDDEELDDDGEEDDDE